MSDLRFIVLVVAITIIIVVLSIVFCGVNGFLTQFLKYCYRVTLDRIEARICNVEDTVDKIARQLLPSDE